MSNSRQGYKLWKEKTTTSPSGRHLSHYKTLMTDDDFAEFFITQCTLPVQHGFAPDRWAKAVQLMYPKKPGMPTLDKIRIIQIYEADYNFILRTVWGRRLVWNAQKHNAYMPAQQS